MDPETIGRFRVEGVLGEGGMGVVYRAVDSDGRRVAIKMLRTFLASEELVKRFEREALIRLDHPNLVTVFEAGTTAGTPYIVFELLEGESLEAILDRGPMNPAKAIELGLAVCAGLAAAHGKGIVHRDLKPANVFRCTGGEYKVLDFGIALLTTRTTRLTATGGIIGTPQYLSPEQVAGGSIDARSDIWTLGVLLYEVLSGRPPFDRDSLIDTVVAVLRDQHIPLAAVAPGVPPGLGAVIERALHKAKAERWQSAESMAEALRGIDLGPPAVGDAGVDAGRDVRGPSAPEDRPTTPPERVVAVLLATGPRDPDALATAIESRGGLVLPMGEDRTVGVFGTETSEGDEAARALDAALDARPFARALAVSSGRAALDRGTLSGIALEAAEAGCAAGLPGVAVDVETARGLGHVQSAGPSGFVEVTSTRSGTGTLAGPQTPLRGRDAELARIEDALRAAFDDGRATLLLVTGPPGIGKTRICVEARRLVQQGAWRAQVVWCRAHSHLREANLSVFEPLGIAPGAPSQLREQALLDHFEDLCRRGPLALFVEDLHWADVASTRALLELTDRLVDAPFVLACTARPEADDGRLQLFEGRDAVNLALRGLATSAVALIAADVLGEPLAEPAVRALGDHTGGNPLFVEQILGAIKAKGAVAGELQSFPLPARVEVAAQARLDHLTAPERELCAAVAVLARPFSIDEAKALVGRDVTEDLAALCRLEILSRRRNEHLFRSALVGEVAGHLVAGEERAAAHRKAASVLEALGGNAEEIGSHHERGGRPREAALAYASGALAAARAGDAPTAVRCAMSALRPEAPEVRFQVLIQIAEALGLAGHPAERQQALEMAFGEANPPRVC